MHGNVENVEIAEGEEDASKEGCPQRLWDGEFELWVSGALASSVDDWEEALLKTNYPALRDALGKHLAQVSKKTIGEGGGEVKANPILYRIEVKRVSSTSVPDPRGPRSEIPLSDALMAGLGVFGLKYPSLLKFDEASSEGVMRYNRCTESSERRVTHDQLPPAERVV
jgi:hypothetical protein